MSTEIAILDAVDAEISRAYGIEAALTGLLRSPCEQTTRGTLDLHLDHGGRLVDIKDSLAKLFQEQGKLASYKSP
jgi:hypothetical protein